MKKQQQQQKSLFFFANNKMRMGFLVFLCICIYKKIIHAYKYNIRSYNKNILYNNNKIIIKENNNKNFIKVKKRKMKIHGVLFSGFLFFSTLTYFSF